MRYHLTVEGSGDRRLPHLPEAELSQVLRAHGLRLAGVEKERLPLCFVGWRPVGGAWLGVACGTSKAVVREACRGVQGVKILPLGCSP
jgi:hypothetical protein